MTHQPSMKEEEIKAKGDEILEILERDLVQHIKGVLKISANQDLSDKEAEVILAKIGKRLILKILSN